MATDDPDRTVQGQTFEQPFELTAAPTEPHHGLYQPYYLLSEAHFMRLGRRSTVASTIGAALTTFGVTQGLPLLAQALRHSLPERLPLSEWLIPLGATLVGLLVLGLALTVSRERRQVTKEIRQYFKDNPGRPVIRKDAT